MELYADALIFNNPSCCKSTLRRRSGPPVGKSPGRWPRHGAALGLVEGGHDVGPYAPPALAEASLALMDDAPNRPPMLLHRAFLLPLALLALNVQTHLNVEGPGQVTVRRRSPGMTDGQGSNHEGYLRWQPRAFEVVLLPSAGRHGRLDESKPSDPAQIHSSPHFCTGLKS